MAKAFSWKLRQMGYFHPAVFHGQNLPLVLMVYFRVI
jgi:hypothetical protein